MEKIENTTSIINHIEWFVMFMTLIGGFYAMDSRIDAINARFDQYIIAAHEESKDFHGRLCAIEERNKK